MIQLDGHIARIGMAEKLIIELKCERGVRQDVRAMTFERRKYIQLA
jgi:hypothetical protein